MRRFLVPYLMMMVVSGCGGGSSQGAALDCRNIGSAQCDIAKENVVELRLPSGSSFCSGVVLESGRILTAAHCMTDKLNLQRGLTNLRGTEFSVIVKGREFRPLRVEIPQSFAAVQRGEDIFFDDDRALVDVRGTLPVLGVPIFEGQGLPENTLSVVGYFNGVLGAKQVSIDIEYPGAYLAEIRPGNDPICPGDSGSPGFVLQDQQAAVAALVSSGQPTASGECLTTDRAIFVKSGSQS